MLPREHRPTRQRSMAKYTASLEIRQLTGEGKATGEEVTEDVSFKVRAREIPLCCLCFSNQTPFSRAARWPSFRDVRVHPEDDHRHLLRVSGQHPSANASPVSTLSVCLFRVSNSFPSFTPPSLLLSVPRAFPVSPPLWLRLSSVRVHNDPVTIVDLSGPDSMCTYAFKWATSGLTPSKRGKRTVVNLSLQFQGNLALMLPLQVKLYADSDHLTPTTALHHIEYECKQAPGANLLEICATQFHRKPARLPVSH